MGKIMIGTYEVLKIMYGTDEVSSLSMGGETIPVSGGSPSPTPTPYNYSAMPFTIEMLSAGTIEISGLENKSYNYSVNNGSSSQINFTVNGELVTITGLSAGDKVEFTVPNNQDGPSSSSTYFKFTTGCTAPFNVYGNIISLQQVDYTNAMILSGNSCFREMFRGNTKVIDASNLIIPDVGLTSSCCEGMFRGATNLIAGPQILATHPSTSCMKNMFYGCGNLAYIKCMFSSVTTAQIRDWVVSVAATGTFVKAAGVTWPSGGIPTGWTIEEYTPPTPSQ